MYFRNKFNKETQKLTRCIEKIGAKTTIGDKAHEPLFVFQGSKHTDSMNPDYIKIFPLVMYDTLKSSKSEDIIYNDSDLSKNRYSGVIIAKNNPGTIITCGKREEYEDKL